ncbi:MAG: hypothetical protein IJT26_03160 [Bacteroidales bacterium]|nr:hypothetical protein [Bacteroidales bacterium]
MKQMLLILAIIFSEFFFGQGSVSNRAEAVPIPSDGENPALSTTAASSSPSDRIPSCAGLGMSFSSARGANVTGEESGFSPSVRTVVTGRRAQPSVRESHLYVRCGRLFGRSESRWFASDAKLSDSGIFSSSRYIYSICRLRD